MHGQELTRFVIGIIGNVISGLLFLSPTPTFWRIHKKKTTEAFHPYPYLASVMNCILWIFYGLPMVHPNSILVVINSGLFLELCYLAIFFCYTNKKNRGIIVLFLLAEAALFAGESYKDQECGILALLALPGWFLQWRRLVRFANLYSFDLYIAIGNGVGGFLGLVQLLVYGFYTFKAWRGGPVQTDVKPGEVQLQNVANRPSV
ncbi:UNVERIFIED_CONTAM: Bidirectional sugar transporter SWEET6b [Sesamum angustifolium]|uniref:Bidirectional sugar transporter SWEET6b n=1 Tax=Sesamum angustifolium TaxID=2727405 RepID=A0AAW2NNE4_9LAMI